MSKIVIIGAGVIGAAIAYELSLISGLEITLLEEKTPASGSTGAALGVLMGIISHKTKGRLWQLRETSIQRYETLIPELEALTGKKIPYNRQGIVKLIFEDQTKENWQELLQWEKLIQIRDQQGYLLELWPREKLENDFSYLNLERIIGAVYSPQDRQLDPTLLTEALLAGASKNGVKLELGAKVQNFDFHALNGTNSGQCKKVYTPNGELEADWLIIAGGVGSTLLTERLQQKIEIRPVLGQGLQFKLPKIPGNPQFQPVITGDDLHLVPLGKGEYWVGATLEFPNSQGEVEAKQEILENFNQKAIALYPFLKDGKIIRTWWGKRPRPEGRSAPIIEKLSGFNNVLIATGHYRNGVLLAPATAISIREEILRKPS